MKDYTPLLKSVFGYDQFKPLQREVIENVLARRDTLAIMPTGGGKSLCYQIPALVFEGLTVVVSPLIALMKDQVEQLRAVGVPALYLNSTLSAEEYSVSMARVRRGEIKLLYVAPETLLTPRLYGLLDGLAIDCLTIDEAHCISEWGHDFRPEYRQLAEVRQRYPKAVCLALTATATERVRQDIQQILRFESSNQFVASFDRPNLLVEVLPKIDATTQTLHLLQSHPGQSGIIYCFSRRQVDELTQRLQRYGYTARSYHAGLDDETRHANQDAFVRDEAQIIVATIAFGMGINKPNVRFVLHYDLPKSIESYYQEIGRAGRDGLESHCVLLYSYADTHKQRFFIEQKSGPERSAAEEHLKALVRYAESGFCRRRSLLGHFGEKHTRPNCGMCDNCLVARSQQEDVTIPAQKLLSCAKRTGERFGAAHLADVLLGEETDKVRKHNHQAVSTFGIGKELTRQQWMHLAHSLADQGLLVQDERYGSLQLSPAAYEALKNRTPILGVLLHARAETAASERATAERAARRSSATGRGVAEEVNSADANPELFELLRHKRKELAESAGVPPYVIFSDRTLVEMAFYYPQTEASLLQINGVGQVKLTNYGAAFLAVIRAYCQANGLSERSRPGQQRLLSQRPPAPQAAGGVGRHQQVAQAFNEGESIEELAERYQVQKATILSHLERYMQEGGRLEHIEDIRSGLTLDSAGQERALDAFAALGPLYLRPVFDQFEGQVTYDELRTVRLYYLARASGNDSAGKAQNR